MKDRMAMCLSIALLLTAFAGRADAISCNAGTDCYSPNCNECISGPQGSVCQAEWSSASCGCGWDGPWDDPNSTCWDVGSCQYGPCFMVDATDPAASAVRLAGVCWPWEPQGHTPRVIRDAVKLARFPSRTVLGSSLKS